MIRDEFMKTAKLNEQQKEYYETVKFNPTKEQYYKLFPGSSMLNKKMKRVNTVGGAIGIGAASGLNSALNGGDPTSIAAHAAGGAVLGAGAGYLGSTLGEMTGRGINKMKINHKYKKAIKQIPENELDRIMSLPESEQKKSLIKHVKRL